MPTHVALLRGINVGGRNAVAMSDLRAVVSSLGHTDVTTYVQSGNVVFSTPFATPQTDSRVLAAALEAAVADSLRVRPRVVVLSRAELAQVVADNPYRDEPNPKCVHAVFLSENAGPELVDGVAAAQREAARNGSRDSARVVGRAVFVHTPDGYGRSELAAAVARRTDGSSRGVSGTARNWATVTRLLKLLQP